MKKGKRHSELMASSDVLESLLNAGRSGLSQHFSSWRLAQKWPEIVGPMIAQRSEILSLNRGVLVIWVPSSVVLQEMNFMADALREKVNAHLGSPLVKQVRFTLEKRYVAGGFEKFAPKPK